MNDIPEALRERLRASRTPVLDAMIAGRVSPVDAFLSVDRSFHIDALLAVADVLAAMWCAMIATHVRDTAWLLWFFTVFNFYIAIRRARSWWAARRKHLDAVERVRVALEAMKADAGEVTP